MAPPWVYGGMCLPHREAVGSLVITVSVEGVDVNPGGPLNMQQLLAEAQKMQEKLISAQQELADALVQGTAGGGLVTATVNGQGELVDLSISQEAIDPGDPAETAETLADLVLAAVRDANRAVTALQQEKMGPLAEGLGGGLGGLGGLGELGGPGMPGLPGM
jgi:DNA-binding YbaB/EbfC family protein